ncbi:MAG: alkylmercury lyase [Chloroflexi bacterium]|nr:alkylmercury lyase [Chloroflexota bacterium]
MRTRLTELAARLNQAGVPPGFGHEESRLLVRVMKALAEGRPLASREIDAILQETGVGSQEAEQFLRRVTERDSDGNIVGIIGLSLNPDWAHRFRVNGKSLRTWCAWDTLFIPLLIERAADVESESPLSKRVVRVKVSPSGVKDVEPESAVVSVVALDPEREVGSVEEAWSQFCHHVYFFASRQEAEEWIAGRESIEVLTVDEAFELGRLAWASVLERA